jgi:hypothetical protein
MGLSNLIHLAHVVRRTRKKSVIETVSVSKMWPQSFVSQSQKMESHHFYYILFIRSKSRESGYIQKKGTKQECEYQEASIIGGHLRSMSKIDTVVTF